MRQQHIAMVSKESLHSPPITVLDRIAESNDVQQQRIHHVNQPVLYPGVVDCSKDEIVAPELLKELTVKVFIGSI